MFLAVITIVNILLWGILFVRLRNFLSPDGILKDARKQMNQMLSQINSATERSLALLDDRIELAKRVRDEADKRIQLLNRELSQSEKSRQIESIIYGNSENDNEVVIHDSTPLPESAPSSELVVHASSAGIPSSDTLNKTLTPIDSYKREMSQGSLKTESVSVQDDMPKFVEPKEKIVPKKSYSEKVMELYRLGYSVDDIAREVGRSTQEIKFTIEIS